MEQISSQREKDLEELEKKLGTSFLNKVLLNQSLTHSSYGHENKIPDNERMEFLGDAILKLIISEYIYHKYPDRAEGDLTKIRAAVISDDTLAGVGKKLNLGDSLLMSVNEKRTGGVKRKSNLANAFEAIIGALYIDAGIGKSRDLIVSFLQEEVEKVSCEGYITDYKSTLQEFVQKQKWDLPRYKVVRETGPRHRRVFLVEIRVRGRRCGVGKGGNKKEAQQRAAKYALENLKKEEKEEKRIKKTGLRGIISQVRKRIKI